VIIEDQTNLRDDVRRILAMPGPVLVDVRVIPDEVRAPRLQFVGHKKIAFRTKSKA
jgi:acetolactate synthase-1/2/3 large subunit